jgi:hypothetical protein
MVEIPVYRRSSGRANPEDAAAVLEAEVRLWMQRYTIRLARYLGPGSVPLLVQVAIETQPTIASLRERLRDMVGEIVTGGGNPR